jgi:hypothetical protein
LVSAGIFVKIFKRNDISCFCLRQEISVDENDRTIEELGEEVFGEADKVGSLYQQVLYLCNLFSTNCISTNAFILNVQIFLIIIP